MDSLEYENIQAALRKKLHRGREGYLGNREEAYREGVRAAMSILSSHQKYNRVAEWIEIRYGEARCTGCKSLAVFYNKPAPEVCPVCGAKMIKKK